MMSSTNNAVKIAAQRNIFGQLLMLSQEHDISLESVMAYPMSPIPWALATADGMPAKTDKAKLMHQLETKFESEQPQHTECFSVLDGMALLQSMTGIPSTFGYLADKVLSLLPPMKRVDFITDTYSAESIKASERTRRGQSEKFLLKGPSTKIPKDWKMFLSSGDNKTQLIELLVKEWQRDKNAVKLLDREILVTSGKICTKLTSTDGESVDSVEITDLESTHEEADTKIILHSIHQSASSPRGIIVRSSVTDVFLLLMHFTFGIPTKLFMDAGVGNHRRMIPVSDLAAVHGQQFCEALLGLHAFSGCDSTSSFVRKGKITVLKTLRQHPHFQATF
jgi:hypothetical protein